MKKIKIWFCDFWPNYKIKDNFIINNLKNNYEVELTKKNPDYLFYSNFGYENIKYNCIKIFYTGENVFPNFNICDYAIGPHEIKLYERYFQLPIYLIKKDNFIKLPERSKLTIDNLKAKRKFCNFVYNNKKGDEFRKEFFYELCQYKMVDSAGEFLNNTGYVTRDKLKMQEEYKFTIAFENEKYRDYSTEKIMDAFISRTVPIYWGDKEIDKCMNPKAFINCCKYKDIKLIINKIKEIDQNDDLWLKIVNEPIFIQENFCEETNNKFNKFLIDIIENKNKQVPNSLEARRNRTIIKRGCGVQNLIHKVHRFKVEKWK